MVDEEQKKCFGLSSIYVVTILFSLVMIGIGGYNIDWNNSDVENIKVDSTCKVDEKIPAYLFVAGIINIIFIVLRIALQRCCQKCAKGEDNQACMSLKCLCEFGCDAIICTIALAVITLWLAIGSTWTFKAEPNFNDENSDDYCPEYLYNFAFYTCIFGWIFVALAVIFGVLIKFCTGFFDILCCKPCKDADANQV